MTPKRSLTQSQDGSFLPIRKTVWTTQIPASVTTDDIRTHVELIGLDTGRSQLLPSCSISDTSRLPQYITVLWGQTPAALYVQTQLA